MHHRGEILFEARHCTIALRRPAPAILVVRFEGRDVGELGATPFHEMERDFALFAQVELFIDAERGKSASVDVSGEWARWLRRHGERLGQVHMLTGTRFVAMSAALVRKYAVLGERMQIHADRRTFEATLTFATMHASRGARAG